MTNKMSRTKKMAVSASVVLGSLGIGGASFALLNGGTASAASSPQTSTSTGSASATGHKLRQFLLHHAVHSTITVKTKTGYESIDMARGTIGTLSSGSITVNSPDGTSLTATIDAQTKFHNTTEQQLSTGEKVGVIAYDGVARIVNVPKSVAPAAS